eukprot:TRINITY_DN7052_c0_g1_i1.p1 TRINITY_DN7052_c0_g1~~TRINITY_DN7052_c0_g1_i1.p1  ORF type:complete len:228 (+),score=37.17 TRINITY_DN7052_c0_g1_i1:31-714(+)
MLILKEGSRVLMTGNGLGRTILHVAAMQGCQAVADLVLGTPNCETDALDDHGCTALHLATIAAHIDLMELLLWRGADPLIRCNAGVDTLAKAAAVPDLPTATACVLKLIANMEVAALETSVSKLDDTASAVRCLQIAARQNEVPLLELILAHQPHAVTCVEGEWSALLYAAAAGHEKVLGPLSRHCDINTTVVQRSGDQVFRTGPLLEAAKNNHSEVVRRSALSHTS